LARIIQGVFRLALGRPINPPKVQAHFTRALMASTLSNMILATGRSVVGRDLVELVRIRAGTLNGCPF
jgi:hypothetical protein